MRDENTKSSGTTRMPRLCGRTHEGPTHEGLTPDALRVEALRKGHRHKTTQEKLREVVEVAKTFEATTFANQLMKTARNTQQEQNQIAPVVTVLLVWWETSTTPSATLPCNGKNCAKGGIIGPFARVCWSGTRRQARQQEANFVLYNLTVRKKIFCETALNTWRENKSREGADRLCIHLQYHSMQSLGKVIS